MGSDTFLNIYTDRPVKWKALTKTTKVHVEISPQHKIIFRFKIPSTPESVIFIMVIAVGKRLLITGGILS